MFINQATILGRWQPEMVTGPGWRILPVKTILIYLILIVAALVGPARGVQGELVKAAGLPEASAVLSPITSVQQDEAAEPLLVWEGPALFAEDHTECHRLSLSEEGQAMVGSCDGEQTEVPLFVNHQREWPEILARFAPFQAETQGEKITFQGHGCIGGAAWERAIMTWARFTYA
jgi:hypothetical protein